ncbi:hypothetical protein KBZ20_08285 [Vulcanococcus limneticus Candia 3F8]|uniref:DUF6737 family protein n=1 Tax=Vulcanococcus limneticus TaxID=2170428 RepID=UPI000B983C24|nr:DUF6737 family protein [Vulcanococcus limneticus]MCP9791970.1 hypothetical protein [Vulcanococcus limneticus MW73D5]MCP9893768.1 hypothetical protein [Vulcanococcus limneticus Candia 3F8]MCP9897196.1 hypothetical protein [Vulcanococcus limneticus Candia 3B3]
MADEATAPDSLWQHKPWWCQPWSILLSGVAVVTGSWFLLGRWWITVPLAAGVLLWWWLFLVLVPAAYRAEVADLAVRPGTGEQPAIAEKP